MELSPILPQVMVNARGVVRVRDGHVWIYASDVTDEGGAEPARWSTWWTQGQAVGFGHLQLIVADQTAVCFPRTSALGR